MILKCRIENINAQANYSCDYATSKKLWEGQRRRLLIIGFIKTHHITSPQGV